MRSNDPEMTGRVRALLDAHVVPDVVAPPNLSLLLGEDEGRVRGLHTLYRGAHPVLRTRSLDRLLWAALVHLDAFLGDPPGLRRVEARLVVRDGAVVVDAHLGPALDRIERRLERIGYRVIDVPGVPLDPATLDIARWAPRLELDKTVLGAPGAGNGKAATSAWEPAEERIPVRAAVIWVGSLEDDVSPSQLLVSVAGLLAAGTPEFTREDLDTANGLLARKVYACELDPKGLFAVLREHS